MNDLLITGAGCFLLGVLTTIHPCPLATNIASISMLVGWFKKPVRVAGVVILFISGYLLAFILLALIISSGIVSLPVLNRYIHLIFPVLLGPVLIFTGMLFADLLQLNRKYRGWLLKRLDTGQWSGWYAFPMGFIIALGFCPATAAIFFGLLIPLAIDHDQIFAFPVLYSLGASIPLILISTIIHRGGIQFLTRKKQEKIPYITGWILIAIGIIITFRTIYL